DIAVDHSGLVGRLEGFTYACGDPDRFIDAERTVCQLLLEVVSLDELHDEVRDAALDAHVVHGHDVGMRQPCNRACLEIETLYQTGVGAGRAVEDLDRHRPVQPGVDTGPHRSHAAAAEQRVKLVAAAELTCGLDAHVSTLPHRPPTLEPSSLLVRTPAYTESV